MCRLAMRPSSVSSSMSITSKGAFRPLVQAAGSWPERFAVLDEEFIGLLLWPALRARDAGGLIKFLVDEETAVYGGGGRADHARLGWTAGGRGAQAAPRRRSAV